MELLGLSNLWSFGAPFLVKYCTCGYVASENHIYRCGLGNSHCDLLFQVFGCRCLILNGRWTLACQSHSYRREVLSVKKKIIMLGFIGFQRNSRALVLSTIMSSHLECSGFTSPLGYSIQNVSNICEVYGV